MSCYLPMSFLQAGGKTYKDLRRDFERKGRVSQLLEAQAAKVTIVTLGKSDDFSVRGLIEVNTKTKNHFRGFLHPRAALVIAISWFKPEIADQAIDWYLLPLLSRRLDARPCGGRPSGPGPRHQVPGDAYGGGQDGIRRSVGGDPSEGGAVPIGSGHAPEPAANSHRGPGGKDDRPGRCDGTTVRGNPDSRGFAYRKDPAENPAGEVGSRRL